MLAGSLLNHVTVGRFTNGEQLHKDDYLAQLAYAQRALLM